MATFAAFILVKLTFQIGFTILKWFFKACVKTKGVLPLVLVVVGFIFAFSQGYITL